MTTATNNGRRRHLGLGRGRRARERRHLEVDGHALADRPRTGGGYRLVALAQRSHHQLDDALEARDLVLDHLRDERGLSPRTREAYEDELR